MSRKQIEELAKTLTVTEIVEVLRNQGIPEEHIRAVVNKVLNDPDETIDHDLMMKKEDLGTLAEISESQDVPYGRLLSWVARGHLEVRGRERFPARGGGKLLVSEADVIALKLHPPKNGRPKKMVSMR